jgi:hypothetical protein
MRFARTLTEAFPQHYAWRGVLTHYRRPLAERITRALGTAAVLATFALIGGMLAWRG